MVVINNSASERSVEIPVWEIGVTDEMTMIRAMATTEDGYNVGRLEVKVKNGMVSLDMEGNSGVLLMTGNEKR